MDPPMALPNGRASAFSQPRTALVAPLDVTGAAAVGLHWRNNNAVAKAELAVKCPFMIFHAAKKQFEAEFDFTDGLIW